MKDKLIKIARLGRKTEEFYVDNGTTVSDLISMSSFSSRGCQIRVNGVPANSDQVLEDGDIVTLIPMIRGGFS